MSAAWNAHPAAAGATGAAAAADPVAYEYATPPTHQNPGVPMPPVRQVPHGAGAREHLIELLLDGSENTDVPAEAMDGARARAIKICA